jgi:hypothetical protein
MQSATLMKITIFLIIGYKQFEQGQLVSRRKKKGKDWLARNQDNVSECDDMCIRGLLFQ